MSNNKTVVWLVVVVIVLIAGFIFYMNSTRAPEPPEAVPPAEEPTVSPPAEPPPAPSPQTQGTVHTVTFADNAFSPKELTIKKGDVVTWVNNSNQETRPASAIHPTHGVYPGSGLEKCGTAEEPKTFDACDGVVPGNSWSFQFNEVGEWRYHDHLRSSVSGKITVTE